MRNYFKNGHRIFFFDDASLEATRNAYALAVGTPGGTPVLLEPLPWDGPWDGGELVGHRRRSAIQADLARSSLELEELVDERTGAEIGWRERIVRGIVDGLTLELEQRDRAQFRRKERTSIREVA